MFGTRSAGIQIEQEILSVLKGKYKSARNVSLFMAKCDELPFLPTLGSTKRVITLSADVLTSRVFPIVHFPSNCASLAFL